jgi:hypothetical protein
MQCPHATHQLSHPLTQPPTTRCAGPTPLAYDTPFTIATPTGAYVRTDNATNYAYPGSGSGSSPPELFTAYLASNTSERSPIQPGQTALMQSVQTGLWCRLAPLPSNASQTGMVCDQPSAATATPLTYTGDGLAYNGVALVSPGGGQPLLLANTTSTPVVGPTADNLALTPVAPAGGWCDGKGRAVSVGLAVCHDLTHVLCPALLPAACVA